MRYAFYPGCSMEATAKANLQSIEAVAKTLDMRLEEIPDWNCCGATVASNAVGDFVTQVITARNLAIAESKGLDVVVGCSACYMNLAVTNKRFQEDEHFKTRANEALAEGGYKYNGTLRVRQFFEVLVNDIGFDRIKERVKVPLTGLNVAGYVGCLSVRSIPYEHDDPEHPVLLDKIVTSLGATAVDFPMKARCCGSSNAIAQTEIVLDSIFKILQSAQDGGAQIFVTTCPICQLNIDAYQQMVNQAHGTSFNLPILFFTQLMAIAFGLTNEARALNYNIVSPYEALAAYGVSK